MLFFTKFDGKTTLLVGDTIVWFRDSGRLQAFRGEVKVVNGATEDEPLQCAEKDRPDLRRDYCTLIIGEHPEFLEWVRQYVTALAGRSGLGVRWLPDEPTHFSCVLTTPM